SLIVSLLFVSGLVLGLVYQVFEARQRVRGEVEASAELVFRLLDGLLPPAAERVLSEPELDRLRRALSVQDARHLDIQVLGPGEDLAPLDSGDVEAPAWFVGFVRPA